MKSKPNFVIIENPTDDTDYEEFKKDFLNPFIYKKEIRAKYDISENAYRRLQQRVLKETGLSKKPTHPVYETSSKLVCPTSRRYIQKVNDHYLIVKTTDYLTNYYGRYKDLDTAMMVRNKLVASDWDKDVAEDLKFQYAMPHKKPTLERAKLIYDDFKEDYFKKEQTIKELKEKYDINFRVYNHLIKLLREEFGEDIHRSRV